MPTVARPREAVDSAAPTAPIVAADAGVNPVQVYNCSRLGLRANPPTVEFGIKEWLRKALRRR